MIQFPKEIVLEIFSHVKDRNTLLNIISTNSNTRYEMSKNLLTDFVLTHRSHPDFSIDQLSDENEIFESISELKYLTSLLYNLDIEYIIESISQLSEVLLSRGIDFIDFRYRNRDNFKTPVPRLKVTPDCDMELSISSYMNELISGEYLMYEDEEYVENLRATLDSEVYDMLFLFDTVDQPFTYESIVGRAISHFYIDTVELMYYHCTARMNKNIDYEECECYLFYKSNLGKFICLDIERQNLSGALDYENMLNIYSETVIANGYISEHISDDIMLNILDHTQYISGDMDPETYRRLTITKRDNKIFTLHPSIYNKHNY